MGALTKMKLCDFLYAVRWRKNMYLTNIYWKRFFGSIGSKCTICSPLLICNPNKIFLGNHVRIREMARLEAITEYNGKPYYPNIEIGDDSGFEQGLNMVCAERILIGKQVTVLAYAMIRDCMCEYEDVVKGLYNSDLVTNPIEIGDGCFIGLGARILPGVKLGKHCVIGTNSVVMQGTYDDYSVLVGNPARCIKHFDTKSNSWEKTSC